MAKSNASYSVAICQVTGKLYGVGVGPGDPELITIKAANLICKAKVIAYPAPVDGDSFARSIAEKHFHSDSIEIPISIPMQESRFPAQFVYKTAAAEISNYLNDGTDVVALCQGDPFFYGSFMYLFVLLAEQFPVEVIPGVSSLSGCSAAAQRPLCARLESFSVLPAPMAETELYDRLAKGGAAAIVKVGRHLPKVNKVLSTLGLNKGAVFISHATLPNQKVLPLAELSDEAPYFSTILVPGRDPNGAR